MWKGPYGNALAKYVVKDIFMGQVRYFIFNDGKDDLIVSEDPDLGRAKVSADDYAKEMIPLMDADGMGTVDRTEFITYMTKKYY